MFVKLRTGKLLPVLPRSWDCDPALLQPGGEWLYNREKYQARTHVWSEPLFIDTETSHTDEKTAWVHQWGIRWGVETIVGRTAPQLAACLQRIAAHWGQKGKTWGLLAYIHNLSYDINYLYQFFDAPPELFAVKPHRILTAKLPHLEIRCSYLLTQKSLAQWSHDSGKLFDKLSGTYDYQRIIYPDDPLTDDDWMYQLNDIYTMQDAWRSDREIDGYTAMTVPLTSTGFVRADCRKAAAANRYWSKKLHQQDPDIEIYNALEAAFSGGYTHGNRFCKTTANYDGTPHIVTGPIGHRDFTSSYPARQMCNRMPMGPWQKIEITKTDEIYSLAPYQALLIHLVMQDIRLKDDGITAPFLSYAKLEGKGNITNMVVDNGRVLALDGIVSIWVTEYDFFILDSQYDFRRLFANCYASTKEKLPKWFRDVVTEYFRAKTTLKYTDPANYMRGKAKLNGIYGMTAERNVRSELKYVEDKDNPGKMIWVEEPPEDRAAALQTTINKYNYAYPFAWGVWTTSIARYELFRCIETIGYDKYLYADTDSIFYKMDEETEHLFDEYNREQRKDAEYHHATCEYNGKLSVLGEFTCEDDMPIKRFAFVHAKCYALEDKDGKLKVTIAGVTKRQRSDAGKTNADELGSLERLVPGTIFRECGGSRIVYNTQPAQEIELHGHRVWVGMSAVILDSEYQITDMWDPITSEQALIAMLVNPPESDIYGAWEGLK